MCLFECAGVAESLLLALQADRLGQLPGMRFAGLPFRALARVHPFRGFVRIALHVHVASLRYYVLRIQLITTSLTPHDLYRIVPV